MGCPLCEEFKKTHPLSYDEEDGPYHVLDEGIHSDPICCAFEEEIFSTDNWCCETMRLLRRLFVGERMSRVWNNDCNLGVVPIPVADSDDGMTEDGIQQGFLVLSWYKNRGRTGQAMVFWDDDEPKPLTLKTAMFIIKEMNLKGAKDGNCSKD